MTFAQLIVFKKLHFVKRLLLIDAASLRKQPTFRDTTDGFPAKWRLRKQRRNSILMTRTSQIWDKLLIGCKFASSNRKHYPDLGSGASSFLRHHFVVKPPVASRNVDCFLTLQCNKCLETVKYYAIFYKENILFIFAGHSPCFLFYLFSVRRLSRPSRSKHFEDVDVANDGETNSLCPRDPKRILVGRVEWWGLLGNVLLLRLTTILFSYPSLARRNSFNQ